MSVLEIEKGEHLPVGVADPAENRCRHVCPWQRKIKELLAPAFNLKAHKQLPILRAGLLRHQQALLGDKLIASKNLAA